MIVEELLAVTTEPVVSETLLIVRLLLIDAAVCWLCKGFKLFTAFVEDPVDADELGINPNELNCSGATIIAAVAAGV